MLNNANNANLLLKSDYFIWLSRYAQTNINENTHWTMFTNAIMAAAVQANRHGLPLKTVCGGSRQFYEWVMFKNRQTMIMLIMSLRGVIAATSVQNQRNGPVLTFYSKFSQNCCLPWNPETDCVYFCVYIYHVWKPGLTWHIHAHKWLRLLLRGDKWKSMERMNLFCACQYFSNDRKKIIGTLSFSVNYELKYLLTCNSVWFFSLNVLPSFHNLILCSFCFPHSINLLRDNLPCCISPGNSHIYFLYLCSSALSMVKSFDLRKSSFK